MSAIGYQFKRDFNEYDPEKKDEEWMGRLVTQFRQWMQPLVDRKRAARNRSYLLGEQDVTKYKLKFHKPDDLPFEFSALGLFEKTRNILTAEREKAGIYLQMNALDPTSAAEKDFDRKLFINAPDIERMLTYAQTAIGMPPFSLANEKDPQGQKLTNGNIESFKDMGLDPNSQEDIAYFFKTHYRLDTEIAAEDVVNHFVRVNELQEMLKEWCDDTLAIKAIAARVYCDELTQLPKFEYLLPEDVRWIKGNRRDGKDAKAIMHEKDMTVDEFLRKVGSEIRPENIEGLINSVNYKNSTSYDGLSFSNGNTSRTGCVNACSYDTFLTLKISIGYIEFKSIDVDTKKIGRNTLGNINMWTKPYEWKPVDENKNYRKEQLWNIVTYKTYFISTSSNQQVLFKRGKLFDQVTYGPEDEYSSFSFQLYKQPGQSAIDIAIPFLDNAHDAWYRFNWILNKAKPKGTRYNYNVIAKIATKMYKEDEEHNGVLKVIQMFQNSVDDFYVNDSLNPNVGGGQNPHFDRPNGLDESVVSLYQVFKDQQELISEKLGSNSIREAYSPNPNDGYKLQMQSLAQSRNATEYMSSMIMSLLVNFSIHTVCIVQDMIEYKGKGYDNIEKAIGFHSLDRLRALKKVPLHKFGIFVESFNTDLERQEQKREALDAWQKDQIQYHVYLLIKNIDNYKKAAQVLAYEKAKEIKRKQQELQAMHQQKLEEIDANAQAKLAEIQAEYKGKLTLQKETNVGLIEVATINNNADYNIKKMSLDAEPTKADVRANAKIKTEEANARIKRGEPVEEDYV